MMTSADLNFFGPALHMLRLSSGKNQRQLSEVTGISKYHLSRCETGVDFPNLRTLVEVLEVIGADLVDLQHAMKAAQNGEPWTQGSEPHQGARASSASEDTAIAIENLFFAVLSPRLREMVHGILADQRKVDSKERRIDTMMHSGEDIPSVKPGTSVRDAIYEMSRGKLGMVAICDEDRRLVGCLSDGDLRRLLEKEEDPLRSTVSDCMTTRPRTIAGAEFASSALRVMVEAGLTSLFVCDEVGLLEGIVHIHDLYRLEFS